MLQLNPPLWLETPKGVGLAHFATWDSLEHSIHWTVFLENGQIWTFENEQVRACKNVTLGRTNPEPAWPFAARVKAPPLVRGKKRA